MNKSQIHAILQAPDEVFLAILQAGAMFHEANIHIFCSDQEYVRVHVSLDQYKLAFCC